MIKLINLKKQKSCFLRSNFSTGCSPPFLLPKDSAELCPSPTDGSGPEREERRRKVACQSITSLALPDLLVEFYTIFFSLFWIFKFGPKL